MLRSRAGGALVGVVALLCAVSCTGAADRASSAGGPAPVPTVSVPAVADVPPPNQSLPWSVVGTYPGSNDLLVRVPGRTCTSFVRVEKGETASTVTLSALAWKPPVDPSPDPQSAVACIRTGSVRVPVRLAQPLGSRRLVHGPVTLAGSSAVAPDRLGPLTDEQVASVSLGPAVAASAGCADYYDLESPSRSTVRSGVVELGLCTFGVTTAGVLVHEDAASLQREVARLRATEAVGFAAVGDRWIAYDGDRTRTAAESFARARGGSLVSLAPP